jgi:hypothetical protein
MRILFLPFLALLFIISCKPAEKPAETTNDTQALEDQLMAVHDEVMPKLTDMQTLSADLRKIKSSIPENSEGKIVSPQGLDQNIEGLRLAEQGMWDWMKQYHDQRDSVPADQLKPFLDHQMELIKSVENGVNSSIANAEEWLKANSKPNGQ